MPDEHEPKDAEQFASRSEGAEEVGNDDSWYKQAVERAPHLMMWVDARWNVRASNDASVAILSERLKGSNLPAYLRVRGEQDLGELLRQALGGLTVAGVEANCIGRDGMEHVFLLTCFPFRSPGKLAARGVLVVGTDITTIAQREAALRADKEVAEAAARLKSTILNSLSHEIRTPLTAILGFTELLYDELTEPHREFVELIRMSGKRLMGTLVSVLELARLDSGDVRFDVEVIHLEQEVREAMRLLEPLAERKRLRLTLTSTAPGLHVRADRTALNRVVNNLVANAIKFTEQGAVDVTIREVEGEAVMEVRDTGIGMSEAFLPQLFAEFKQETDHFARQPEGAGLGLAITKRLVDEMDGRITVTSVKGHGSVFTVYLPSVVA